MNPYVTPRRLETMGLGANLEGLEEYELHSLLSRASEMANAYCAAPVLPQKHDFRGGVITNEEHAVHETQRRFFFRHTPIKAITGFRLHASNTVMLSLSPDQLFLNNSGGYCEVVATQLTLAGSYFPPTPFWGLQIPVLRIDYTYGYDFEMVDELLEPTDAHEYRGVNQFWFTDPTPIIRVNGDIETNGFTSDHREGAVIFEDAQPASTRVTASYHYPLPTNIAEAVGIIARHLIQERDTDLALGGMAEIQIEEVRLRRDARRGSSMVVTDAVPDSAKALLNAYVFNTVM